MKEVSYFVRASFIVVILFVAKSAFAITSAPALSADEIIQKAVARVKTGDHQAHPDYAVTRVTTREERDTGGQLKDRNHKAEEIVFRRGNYVRQSVGRNDANPTKAKSRSDMINLLTPDVIGKYSFELVGNTNLNNRVAYELAFQPKRKMLCGKDLTEKILNQASGHLWIDAEEFELVKAQVHVDSEVPVAGILGALKKAAFSLERVRLEAGLWLERYYKTEYEARKLIDCKRVMTEAEFSNFRRVETTAGRSPEPSNRSIN